MAHAAYYGHVETVKLLLEHKASPNIANVNRTTSLHTAVYSPFGRLEIGKLEIVKLLLDHGADLFARDINGKTAYDLAEAYLRDYLYQRMHSDKTA